MLESFQSVRYSNLHETNARQQHFSKVSKPARHGNTEDAGDFMFTEFCGTWVW